MPCGRRPALRGEDEEEAERQMHQQMVDMPHCHWPARPSIESLLGLGAHFLSQVGCLLPCRSPAAAFFLPLLLLTMSLRGPSHRSSYICGAWLLLHASRQAAGGRGRARAHTLDMTDSLTDCCCCYSIIIDFPP